MPKFPFLLVAMPLLLAGCGQAPTRPSPVKPTLPTEPLKLSSNFQAQEAKDLIGDGSGLISGSAFMRQRGGGVVTCAGADVLLIPATTYAAERQRVLFKSSLNPGSVVYRSSINYDYDSIVRKFDPDPAEYHNFMRRSVCDAQGNFAFSNVKDGRFFVVTSVVWTIGTYTPQGGYLATAVDVRSGKAERLVLSQ